MRSLLFILIFLFSSLFFASSGLADSRLQLIDPWVRQAPPTSKNLAGYGELKNTSGSAFKIVSIKSTLFENIEMHVTTFEKGMMRMAEIKELSLSPKESVYFEPGGRHFMLIKPKEIIKADMNIPIEITLNSGMRYHFEMKVRR